MNQRLLTDFPEYAEKALKIVDKSARLVPFVLNRAQRALWAMIKEDLDAGRPVRVYVLKARQLGFSTLIQGIEFWRHATRPYQHGQTISHEVDSATEIHRKSQVFYQNLPDDLRPMRKRSNRREMYFATDDGNGGLLSLMTVATADSPHLGASRTMQFLHCSEFARWERVNKTIRVAFPTLLQTVPDVSETFVFLETTAWGINFAKDVWDAPGDGYRKVFVSWCADDEYRLNEGLADGDLMVGPYGDEPLVANQVEEQLKFWYPEESASVAWLQHEVLCRMAWRRQKIAAGFQYDLDLFRQEYPITPEEAFVTSGEQVFDQATIDIVERSILTSGEESRPEPLYLPQHYVWASGTGVAGGAFHASSSGDLRVYEDYDTRLQYVIGADVGEGLRAGDESAAQIISLPDLKQVATYQGLINPTDFARVLYWLGENYGWAYCAVEVNGPGFAANEALANQLFYPNLYWRRAYDAVNAKPRRRYGWHTNKLTKAVMIAGIRTVLRTELLGWRDLPTLEQMRYYVERGGKLGAASGRNDDLVMALGIAIQAGQDANGFLTRPAVAQEPAPEKVGINLMSAVVRSGDREASSALQQMFPHKR